MTFLINHGRAGASVLKDDISNRIGWWFALALLVIVSGCKTATLAYQEKPADEQLSSIQSNLIALNYLDQRHLGSQNPATEAAIRAFQRDNGLPIDGQLSASLYVRSSLAVNKKNERSKAELRTATGTTQTAPPPRPGTVQSAPMAPRSPAAGAANSTNAEPPSCRFAQWEGTVSNLADLFACNEPRAIASLSSGRRVALTISEVRFVGGKLHVESRMQLAALRDMSDQMKKNFTWDTWFRATQAADIYTFTCVMEGGQAANLKVGSVAQFQAKLLSWSSPYGQMTCR